MDVKDLNKSQLILLAILLSFVVSIATGITTVTLMDQAPSSITVPITRVVRETVEKIVPIEGESTTVIVKEEDLVVEAIAENQPAIFSIADSSEASAGKGFLVSESGIIVADAVLAGSPKDYFVSNASGKFKAQTELTHGGISFLRIGEPVGETTKPASFILPNFGDVAEMKIGQKVIVFGEGNISSLIFEGTQNLKLPLSRANAGGAVINLNGEILGISLFNEATTFVPMSTIMEALKTLEPDE